jgi:hypothetical protein
MALKQGRWAAARGGRGRCTAPRRRGHMQPRLAATQCIGQSLDGEGGTGLDAGLGNCGIPPNMKRESSGRDAGARALR